MSTQKTPLSSEHERLGGKMVDFDGWWMPVQFKGLKLEHACVREGVGLFDVSHMGELRVSGEHSLKSLQWLTSNDVSKLKKGQAQYSLLTNFEGGIVDDLIVYCLEPGADYLLCVNASNKDKDLAWVTKNNKGADITDESSFWAQVAIQGPKAMELMKEVLGASVESINSFSFLPLSFKGTECLVARTGYTGEDGVEVFIPSEVAVDFWSTLLKKGEPFDVQPIGLGARDTLRTEMKYSLYGHEIDDSTSPIEAGLGWVVKLEAKEFIGSEKIQSVKDKGPQQKLVGFKMLERGIARQGYRLFSFDNNEVGRVTSGTPSPSLSENIGIAYLPVEYCKIGSEFLVEIRNKKIKAVTVKTPFVQKG